MDDLDRKILRSLQHDASRSQREIAEDVSLSQNACWTRIRKLRESGVIERFTIDVDADSVGIGVIVLMLIKTRHHSEDWLAEFTRRLEAEDEVAEFFRIAGDFDYVVKVMTRDVKSFDAFYKRTIQGEDFETVTSYFVMGDIKQKRGVPLKYSG